MEQIPYPGQHILAFCGDALEFTLRAPPEQKGRAWLRTNIGHADTARLAILGEITRRQKRLAEDWFDIPMTACDRGTFRLMLPITEPGHFEAKAFFLPEGSHVPVWPEGDNTCINVHPAEYCCANGVYNAFVRLFGQEKNSDHVSANVLVKKSCRQCESMGYTVIPPSGTFRDLIRQLDFIFGRLQCRILMLLPIHPTPTVYGRMGEFGSPYAALDFMDVDPALAEFDCKATPLEQFGELVDAVHARGARLFMDIAINHTGWAAKIHSQHPEWLMRNSDGTIRSPGAWGVTWSDLAELDHHHPKLWNYLAEVFLTWCRRGVDGFRCDAGYMIPVPAWEFIVASVRREFPDAIFLLEGLGGRIETTSALLNNANLNWAYSELFQNYDRPQVEKYLEFAFHVSESEGILMHFAETHDNNRLAARSPAYARMRTALAALCSSNGAFAFANGVEWLATEKIDVHKKTSLNWNNPVNQVDHIARLNRILNVHPAFFNGAEAKLIQRGTGNTLALLRSHPLLDKKMLVLINLNDTSSQTVTWTEADAGLRSKHLTDLLSGKEISISSDETTLTLSPGEALCLAPDSDDLRLVLSGKGQLACASARLIRQRLRAKALEALVASSAISDISNCDPDKLADALAADPLAFCRKLNCRNNEENVISWNHPADIHREIMVPPGYFLLLNASSPFRAQLRDDGNVISQQDAIRRSDGGYFALFMPRQPPSDFLKYVLCISVYSQGRAEHAEGHILYLPKPVQLQVKKIFTRDELLDRNMLFLGTNGRGGMMRAAVKWGELRSKYDALLAGNLNPEHPEDRRIMLTRCRVWLVFQSYSQDVTIDRLEKFAVNNSSACWHFRIPFGYGKMVFLEVEGSMLPGANAIRLVFRRLPAIPGRQCLGDSENVRIIIRPDIEDRSFHEETKAFLGPEKSFPQAVRPHSNGFVFAPDPARQLKMDATPGYFQPEPEWQYMVHHPVEAQRGLETNSDLFSPGYFRGELKGGDEMIVSAMIATPREKEDIPSVAPRHSSRALPPPEEPVLEVLEKALRQFVVKRGGLKTVIAGYPWFLDWGRDTLICCRGLIAAGLTDDVLRIIRQFASFEEGGTLPNMIIGANASNRDSSDAPLWLLTACADLKRAIGNDSWLNEKCGGKTLIEALRSIALGYRKGTANGIIMDPESGLIFSPPHFTWMDTNHPAGTPREGYPIEIQALWIAGLNFLAEITNDRQWNELARLAQESLLKLYWREKEKFFADCLHASRGQPAAKAKADDALRPNQLLALTLGAVETDWISSAILSACAELLVPGAIRTLSNRGVEYPLPIERNGKLINDPKNPYWGRYEGDEDSRRKPAYHNGTAWTWLFPSFCEAWFIHYGKAGRSTALAVLNSSSLLLTGGCLGQIPEILDGDFPHAPRGCDAQAWGVSELFRVWKALCPE